MTKLKVLFLCTGNSARSQMAEAFLRSLAGDRFEVYSAGLESKGYILPEVLAVMKEIGLDLSDQHSKGVEEYLGRTLFSDVITVCGRAERNCPQIFLNMGRREHWPFDDPAEFSGSDLERLAHVRELRDRIKKRVRQWLADQTPVLPEPSQFESDQEPS